MSLLVPAVLSAGLWESWIFFFLQKSTGVLPASFVTVSAPSTQHHPPTQNRTDPAAFTAIQRAQDSVRTIWKLRRRISVGRGKIFSTVFCLSGNCWNIKCSPDVIRNFWCIHFFFSSQNIKKVAWAIHDIAKVCLNVFWNAYCGGKVQKHKNSGKRWDNFLYPSHNY